jgi:hypothetical protein
MPRDIENAKQLKKEWTESYCINYIKTQKYKNYYTRDANFNLLKGRIEIKFI